MRLQRIRATPTSRCLRSGRSSTRRSALNLVAVGYSLGLAASVLYFGAVGDRYERKLLLILGMVVTVPADCCTNSQPCAAHLPSGTGSLRSRRRRPA
jgi:MFS family permease